MEIIQYYSIVSLEVSASTIFMLVGALLWACVLGTVLEAMTMFSEKQRQAQVTSDRLKQLVIRYQVPPELADRLSDYFDRFNAANSAASDTDLLHDMSPRLQFEVLMQVHGAWIQKVDASARSKLN